MSQHQVTIKLKEEILKGISTERNMAKVGFPGVAEARIGVSVLNVIRTAPVSERFAKQFFNPKLEGLVTHISFYLLQEGDLLKTQDAYGDVYILNALSPDRVIELYFAARIMGLGNKVRHERFSHRK